MGSAGFLGRAEQIAELLVVLEDCRLVSLVGAPGIGKTSLAEQVAAGYRGQATLVELASVADWALVAGAVASALGVTEVAGQNLIDAVTARLRGRYRIVVLDNCEHLLSGCGELAEAVLDACPKLRVLTTSREPLGIPAERVWRVPALSVPDRCDEPPEVLLGYESVCLFAERAASVQPGFELTSYVAPAVAEICRRLDGIPLAIELAAPRLEMFTPAEIAARLDERFALLRHATRDVVPRHQTLQAALDWSHDLLSPAERVLLRRLSVFAGGFDREACKTVCAGESAVYDSDVLLDGLVSKSLVVTGTAPGSGVRYRLLETIRAYAAAKLDEAGEQAAQREAHTRYYLTLAERAEPELTGPMQDRWFERLDAERANLRLALEWSLGHADPESALRLAGALTLFWRVRCHFTEGRELLEAAVAAADAPPGPRAKALWGAGFMALMAGDIDGAIPLLEQSLSDFRELGETSGCARALLILGNCAQFRDGTRTIPLLEEAAALARQAGDLWCLSHALGIAGFELAARSDLSPARLLLEECLDVARQAQDKQSVRVGLLGLGLVLVRQGDYRRAELLLQEAVSLAVELGEAYGNAVALEYLGNLALARGDYAVARTLLDDALFLLDAVGHPMAMAEPLALLGQAHRAEGDRGRARLLFEQGADAEPGGVFSLLAIQSLAELAAEAGDLEQARVLYQRCLDLARPAGRRESVARALYGLAGLSQDAGESRRADALYQEALELQREIGGAPAIVTSLEAVAGLDLGPGGHERSARLLGATQALRTARGYARLPWEASRFDASLRVVRDNLGADRFESAFAEGAEKSLDEALAEARRGPGGPRLKTGWSSLTGREREVAALVVDSLTTREIAERLSVAHATVKSHLSHIYTKLGVAKRSELAREVRAAKDQRPSGWRTSGR